MLLSWLLIGGLAAQTTQSIVRGQVIDSSTGRPVVGANIRYYNPELSAFGNVSTNEGGYYALTSLSPGNYRIRIEADEFQSRDVYSLDVHVASRVELNINLRPLREALSATPGGVILQNDDAVLPLLGPDLELGRSAALDVPAWKSATLQSSLSYVVDPQQLGELPLAARNVYTMIVTLPGVKAEEVTGRGLGISANGQRPSSSNFLLDGAENNDSLLSGPFSSVAPEGIQEYRITTNNFSAEYGGAGGFMANAVTRSGSNAIQGQLYTYLNNDVLNAASSFQNVQGIRKTPVRQLEAGYWLGGPIRRELLFFSSAFDRYRSRALGDPQTWTVPVLDRFRACAGLPGVGDLSRAIDLLSRFPPPPVYSFDPRSAGSPCALTGQAQVARPVSLDRSTALERLDYRSPSGANRLMARLSISRLQQPDQVFSVYSAFNGAMSRNAAGVALGYTRALGSRTINEVNASWRNATFNFERPLHEIPALFSTAGPQLAFPGSSLPYEFNQNEHQWTISDSLTRAAGQHVLTLGSGVLLRRQRIAFSFLPTPYFAFSTAFDFARSAPSFVFASLSREAFLSRRLALADPRRQYSNNQFFGFAQDSWKISSRVTLNLGVRYESFGTLRNGDAPDGIVDLPEGSTFPQRLGKASFTFPRDHSPYAPDRNNWAGRFGAAYNISNKTTLRAGYGVFYDRPYDNLFLNPANSQIPSLFCLDNSCGAVPIDYTQPVLDILKGRPLVTTDFFNSPPLLVEPNLRTPYVQSWFVGVQQQLSSQWYFEASHMGSLGRGLITSDLTNQIAGGRINPDLPTLWYRSNSGSSHYTALGALARYHGTRADFQASYTWSHSIDNQSDAMFLDPFSLTRFNPENPGVPVQFPQQFSDRADKGNSDFDIRHNLVFYSIWYVPGFHTGWKRRITDGWQLSQLADFRTGLPYTVVYPDAQSDGIVVRNRPNLVPGIQPLVDEKRAGGYRLLNTAAFSLPPSGVIGNLGRNTFTGPGFWNVDLSLAKAFSGGRLGEGRRIQFRADAFNVFNHANLNPPNSDLSSPFFGRAFYGSLSNQAAFPSVTPLYPSPRRIQLQVKLYF